MPSQTSKLGGMAAGGKFQLVLKWGVPALVVIGLFAFSRKLPFAEWIDQFSRLLRDEREFGWLLFSLGYILGTLLFFPGSLMTLAAGAVFGFWGIPLALLSATLGACVAFLIARYAARRFVEEQAARNAKFKQLDQLIGEKGWKIVFLLRLSPLVPFNLSNYLFGLTRVKFIPYALSSLAGMFPGCVLYVYLGHAGKKTLAGAPASAEEYSLLAVGLAATIALVIFITRWAKASLKNLP